MSCNLTVMSWRYLFFAVLLMVVQVMAAECAGRRGTDKKHARLKQTSSNETDVTSRGKAKSLFARRAHQRLQRPLALQQDVKKPRGQKRRPSAPAAPAAPPAPPAPGCPRVKERCSGRQACCDPCATCRCRLFSSVCYCWRPGRHCQRKS